MTPSRVTIVGGGLAGVEAAWRMAKSGFSVQLLEIKPKTRTPAQETDFLAELVCSNSLRSANPTNAVGLLKEEMERLDSLVIAAARATRVPAGDALAVDREAFGRFITDAIDSNPNIERHCQEVTALPEQGETLIATGPLTTDALAQDIRRLSGQERLHFYDAIAPIIAADSIDRDIVYAASRYGKGDGADYLNSPLDKEQYSQFLTALLEAECTPLHPFEAPIFFQGCMPIEETARRGRDSLRYGTMKPVGLRDPRTGASAYAVAQLRQEDKAGQAYNLVGFQTKLKHPEQQRVFRMLPGLERARFLRLGAVHRNTYLDAPQVLDDRMRLRAAPHVRFAGQITGVEGYAESAAHGLLTALLWASDLRGTPLAPPPLTSASGALLGHLQGVTRLPGRGHEPQNINWSLFEPLTGRVPKRERKARRLEIGRKAFAAWAEEQRVSLSPIEEPQSGADSGT